MKILQIIYSLSIGGSEIVSKNLTSKLLENEENEVEIVAVGFGGELEGELSRSAIPYHIIGRQAHEYIGPMIRFYKIFSEFKPDIVHTHHLHTLVYAAVPAKISGAKIVHTEHEFFLLSAKRHKVYLRILSVLCNYVTGVGNDITDFLKTKVKISPQKLRTVINGIEVPQIKGDSVTAREKYKIKPSDKVIGIVARLGKEKDHSTLLESFQLLCQSHSDLLLLIVGEGEERAMLEKKCSDLEISEKVRFVGASNDVSTLLEAMDVFVLSSRAEGLPLSMLEAMAACRPVVVPEIGAIPEVIEHGVNGLLITPGDYVDISEKLSAVLLDQQFADSLASEGCKLVKEKFDLDNSVGEYIKLYNNCLGVR